VLKQLSKYIKKKRKRNVKEKLRGLNQSQQKEKKRKNQQ